MASLCASCHYVCFCAFCALALDSCIYLCETETLDTTQPKQCQLSHTHRNVSKFQIYLWNIHLKYTCRSMKSRNVIHISKYTLWSTRNMTNCRCAWNVIHIWNILYDHQNMTICKCDTCRSTKYIYAEQTSFIFPNTLYEIYATNFIKMAFLKSNWTIWHQIFQMHVN